jgi:hypothetical protein
LDNSDTIKSPKTKKRPYRWLRRLLRLATGVLIFLVLLILFIRSPWGQSIIVDKLVDYVSDKTQTTFEIEKFFITFDGNLQLDGLYLEDQKGDTLVYSKSLEADVPLWKTITGEAVGVENLEWNELKANIIRQDSVSGFNFQFLIDAFGSEDAKSDNSAPTEPVNLILGDFNLSDINITYKDAVSGIDSQFTIGNLITEVEEVDLNLMQFQLNDFFLDKSNFRIIQTPVKTTDESSDSRLPSILVENIELNQVKTYFESESISTEIMVDKSEIDDLQLNLDKTLYTTDRFQLSNSSITINLKSESEDKDTQLQKTESFSFPELGLLSNTVDFENNQFSYTTNNQSVSNDQFNPEAIQLNNLTLKADNLRLKDQEANIDINQLQFVESSGIDLKTLKAKFKLNNQKISVDGLDLLLNDNQLKGFAIAEFKDIDELINSPDQIKIESNLYDFRFSLKEVFRFVPKLNDNTYLNVLSKKQIVGNIKAKGNLEQLKIFDFKLNWGAQTKISTSGIIENLTDVDNIRLSLPKYRITTTQEDINKFYNTQELGVKLPNNLQLTGSLDGTLEDVSTTSRLETSQGVVELSGNFRNQDKISYAVDVKTNDYQLGELLQNSELGRLNFNLQSKASGTDIYTLEGDLKTQINKFTYGDYTFNDINLNGKLNRGEGSFSTNYKDENLNLDLETSIRLDTLKTEISANLNLIGADLYQLGLSNRGIKTGFKLEIDFSSEKDVYQAEAKMDEGVVVYNNESYLLGEINSKAYISNDSTSVDIDNQTLSLQLKSNADPQRINKALNRHISSYFYRDEDVPDSLSKPVNINLKAKIAQTPLIKEVLLVNVNDLDTINLSLDFDEKARQLKAFVTAPHINYAGNEIDNLKFEMFTTREDFNFNLGFNNIKAGPIDIPNTSISGLQKNSELSLRLKAIHDDDILINVNSKITGSRDNLRYSINPDSLILNKKEWKIAADNEIRLINDTISFNNFEIGRNDRYVRLRDNLKAISRSHVALEFEKFNLKTILNYLNPEYQMAQGILNGNLAITHPFLESGIFANLNVQDLNILDTDFGTLTMDGRSKAGNTYNFNAGIKDGLLDLDLQGNYITTAETAELDMALNINKFDMQALNTLSLGEIKNGQGSFSGQFKIKGTADNPIYDGKLNFNNAEFNISKLNTKFVLQNENLLVDNSGLSLNDFTIRDSSGNKLILSGKVGTENAVNPTFDLSFKANDFKILDAQKGDNELFYGKAIFDANGTLKGDLQIPIVDADIDIDSKTDIVYILPPSTASIERRDGIVSFVNRENPDDILTSGEEQKAEITGYDINTSIKITDQSKFKIILDEDSGDNFQVQGQGDLNLRMFPNGRINLYGIYEATSGHYKLSLYNLVKRKFELAPGSRVVWNGDPFNADIDITAIYNVETSASSLMASQTTSLSPGQRSKFKQVLPFNVFLNIEGELFQPEIFFRIDMDEEQRNAVGGQVYAKVQQLNQRESELNQQVFSLLVLNRFYPTPGSDGSTGGIGSLAQQNINDAITDRLNAFSDKLLGKSDIELDFGLDSYTDYQGETATERTQFNVSAQKKFLDDRLTVRVGSDINVQGGNPGNESTPVVGNVSILYQLTEDGRYKLKGFRRNRFENVIDGQTIVSGIALIFVQEFNRFDQLWKAILRKSVDDNEIEKIAEDEKDKDKTDKTEESKTKNE